MKLLTPLQIGELSLPNAIVMAPMTRFRANAQGEVGASTALYYAQRASAGLIVSEAINISAEGTNNPFVASIRTEAQIAGWQLVTQAVHDKGGRIFAQLLHTGRLGHSTDRQGILPFAPSAIAIEGQMSLTSQGAKPYEVPQALTLAQIQKTIADYRQAGEQARQAGFDGVELHGAFGYLPNQFLMESSNQRTDDYGGSIKNRTRFVFEVMQNLVDVCGAYRVGIKLSPLTNINGMQDSHAVALYACLLEQLNGLPLAYLHFMNEAGQDVLGTFGALSPHLIIANGGYTRETGEQTLQAGKARMISYGTAFVANPDLPTRFALNAPLNPTDTATLYTGGEKGYTDYPFL